MAGDRILEAINVLQAVYKKLKIGLN